MPKTNLPKTEKTLYLSAEANEMWAELVRQNGRTGSDFFESLVRTEYQKSTGEEGADQQKEKNIFTAELLEMLSKMKRIQNDTNKKAFVIMEILNSFISNGITVGEDDYTSAEFEPHPWVREAYATLSQKITGEQHSAAAKGKK